MRYTENELRSLFQRRFNSDDWTRFLGGFFEGARLRAVPEEFDTPTDNDKGFFMGEYKTSDHYSIGLFRFDVKAASVARKRVGLRNLVKSLINPRWGMFDAAFAVFVSDTDWRLSFICDIKEEMTAPKRFTYVFGEKSLLYRTPVSRLFAIQGNVTFASLKEAFSVEKLSKDFFREYREIYADFVQYITGNRYVKKTQGSGYELKSFPREPQNKTFYQALGCDDKRARDFVKKMMGRITFLYFLQQKGWMCGDKNYMLHLFEKSQDMDFYLKKVLVPLFFGVLNTKPAEREAIFTAHGWNHALRKEWESIPYLNGGLFDPDDEDRVVDDCQTHIFRKKDFEALFEFFSHYNFTIDENDPSDAEVGVDPEMLGKIFESLLEDNKDKGAFYTPKEIVQYMCQESLIAYLVTKTGIEEGRIHAFVENPEECVSSFNEEEQYKVLDGILSVKICDPAIGSGAFPIGLLNELVRCKEAIYGDKKGRADIKREIIRDNIYGVDIEKGAVDIARLRFWLSLVVDEDTPSPLPNLNYKIMQGNSLLEWYDGEDLSKLTDIAATDSLFGGGRAEELKLDLAGYLKRYFGESDHKNQAELKGKITATIKEILDIAGVSIPDEIDLSENNQFFLWHTWYSEVFVQNGGFDICLGNPPYINVEHLDDTLKNYLFNFYSTCTGRTDIYIGFIEKSLSILAKQGIMTFIIPYAFTNQNYAEPARRNIIDNYALSEIVDTSDYMVFDNAIVKNVILRVRNNNGGMTVIKKASTKDSFINHDFDIRAIDSGRFKELRKCRFETKDFAPLLSLKAHIDDSTFPLRRICFIGYGVRVNSKTDKSKPKAFYVSPVRKDGYKPFVEGKNIERYYHSDSGWLNYRPNEHYNPMFPELFENEKIIFINVVSGQLRFAYDVDSYYNSHTVVNCVRLDRITKAKHISARKAITEGDIELARTYSMKFLLGVLNSALIYWYFSNFMSDGLHIFPEDANTLPIPFATKEQQAPIIALVDEILAAKIVNPSADTSAQEAEIDRLVYDLYDVPQEERKIITRY